MAKLRVDFSKTTDFEAIPAGDYPMVLEETEVRQSEGKEYPYINWTFKIVAGEYTGRKQWLMTSCSPKAAWSLRDTLNALGEDIPAGTDSFDVDPDDYVGREVIGHVIQETYNDKLTNKIESVSAMAGAVASAGGGRKLS